MLITVESVHMVVIGSVRVHVSVLTFLCVQTSVCVCVCVCVNYPHEF